MVAYANLADAVAAEAGAQSWRRQSAWALDKFPIQVDEAQRTLLEFVCVLPSRGIFPRLGDSIRQSSKLPLDFPNFRICVGRCTGPDELPVMPSKFFGQGIGHIARTLSGWNSTDEAGS